MDSLVKIIQNYAAIIGIIYLIATYWNDFGKCLKKNILLCFARPSYTILQRKSTHLCA